MSSMRGVSIIAIGLLLFLTAFVFFEQETVLAGDQALTGGNMQVLYQTGGGDKGGGTGGGGAGGGGQTGGGDKGGGTMGGGGGWEAGKSGGMPGTGLGGGGLDGLGIAAFAGLMAGGAYVMRRRLG